MTGRITVRHRGGGVKTVLRSVTGLPPVHDVTVWGIQRDPQRTAPIALLSSNADGAWSYIVAGEGLTVGTVLRRASDKDDQDLAQNTRCRRRSVPVGLTVYDLAVMASDVGSSREYLRSTLVKSAGTCAAVLRHDETRGPAGMTRLRLPSGEERWFPSSSYASLGKVAAEDHRLEVLGNAGSRRRRGIRPTVRGCAMNPVDHPHGGRTKGGRHDVTPWAKIAKGQPTRSRDERPVFVVKTSRQARHAR